jgi:Mn2+/Fe2+ NRAMP family transporter
MLHSLLAVILVRYGGYGLFEKVMSVCIAVMFVVVVFTAVVLRPPLGEVVSGLFVPLIPPGGTSWTVALIGGVGGTVTVLCYGYWIREEGRTGADDLATCRIDLASGYLMTAVFGVAMVVIGNSLGQLPGGGATLIVEMANKLEATLGTGGTAAKWALLAGAWGAVFSSLLGVWQSIPYLFADLWRMMKSGKPHHEKVDTESLAYRGYLYAIAVVPLVGMVAVDFRMMQKTYAVVGAWFVPMLAVVLLALNGRAAWVGQRHKNSWATTLILVATTLFFVYAGAIELYDTLFAVPAPG